MEEKKNVLAGLYAKKAELSAKEAEYANIHKARLAKEAELAQYQEPVK